MRRRFVPRRGARLPDIPRYPLDPEPDNFQNARLRLKSDPESALVDLELVAETGSFPTMYFLGVVYSNGCLGFTDSEKATHWLELSARGGFLLSSSLLAYIYLAGRQFELAFEWMSYSAALGIPNSMHNLSLMYYEGLGVRRDMTLARFWSEKSASLGYLPARGKIGYWYARGMFGIALIPKGFAMIYAYVIEYCRIANSTNSLQNQKRKNAGAERSGHIRKAPITIPTPPPPTPPTTGPHRRM